MVVDRSPIRKNPNQRDERANQEMPTNEVQNDDQRDTDNDVIMVTEGQEIETPAPGQIGIRRRTTTSTATNPKTPLARKDKMSKEKMSKEEWTEFEKTLPIIEVEGESILDYKVAYLKMRDIVDQVDMAINANTNSVYADQREFIKRLVKQAAILDSEVQVMELTTPSTSNLPAQSSGKDSFLELVKSIEELKKEMQELKEPRVQQPTAPQGNISYANVLKLNPSSSINLDKPMYPTTRSKGKGPNATHNKNLPPMPKIRTSSFPITVKANSPNDEIRKIIKEAKIFTERTKVTPKNIFNLGSNKDLVKIHFDNEKERNLVVNELEKIPNISTKVQKKRNPLAIVLGIPKEMDPAEVKDLILDKNPDVKEILESNKDFKLEFRFKTSNRSNSNNNKRYNAVFECTTKIYRILTQLGKVNLVDERHRVEPFVSFIQCFRCCGFGHTSAKCTEQASKPEESCSFCSGKHSFGTCQEKEKDPKPKPCCINCSKSNKNFKTKYDLGHRATDWNCPSYISAKQRFLSNVEW